jgi:hypothetical protein
MLSHVITTTNNSNSNGIKSVGLKESSIKITKPLGNTVVASARKPKSAALNSYYNKNF